MVRFDIYVNDVHLTTVQGDGVLISTPTGSTAYNLSCGGSIVHAAAEVVCVTPICPHSLSFRPVILPINAKISLVLPIDARTDAWATFDGQTRVKVQRGEQLVI
jgi:NAD kinase